MKSLYLGLVLLALSLSVAAQKNNPAPNSVQPTFSALNMDGKKVDLADLKGKVVAINLWFVNCPNCIEEITLLNQLVDSYKDNKDVVFLGLAASKKALLQQFL